jgi:hypothetical protein
VVADRAARGSAEQAVLAGEMASDTADQGALDAALGLGRMHGQGGSEPDAERRRQQNSLH